MYSKSIPFLFCIGFILSCLVVANTKTASANIIAASSQNIMLSSVNSHAAKSLQQQDESTNTIKQLEEIRSQSPTLDSNSREENDFLSKNSDEDISRYYERGKYIIDIHENNLSGGSYVTKDTNNFFVEVDTQRMDGSTEYSQGFYFRHSDKNNFYAFLVKSDGSFSLNKFVNGEVNSLINDKIKSFGSSRWKRTKLGVLVQDDSISLLIDNKIAAQVTDGSLAEGDIALIAASHEDGPVQISFDNLKMWELSANIVAGDTSEDASPAADQSDLPSKSFLLSNIKELDPTLQFDFSTDMDGRWATYDGDKSSLRFKNGEYVLSLKEKDLFFWQTAEFVAGDFLAEFDASLDSGAPEQVYGLIFRYVDQDNFYRYLVSGDGSYSVYKLMNDEWYDIIPWTESPVIKTGLDKTNRLGVMAVDSEFILIANGEVLSSFEDDSFEFGDIALTISSDEEPNVSVAFDNLTYWNLHGLDARLLIANLDITDLSLSTLLELGDEYYLSNDNEDALTLFNQALKLDPRSVEALVGRGNALRRDDDEAGAFRDFEKAIEIDSDYAPAYRGLAFLADGNGNTEAALQYIESAIESDRSYAFAYYTKGYIYNQQGNIEAARANYDQAIALDPNNSHLYFYRGSFYLGQNDLIMALNDFNSATKLNPYNNLAYGGRGRVILSDIRASNPANANERYRDALQEINKASSLYTGEIAYYINRGVIFADLGAYEKAIANYEQAISLNPEDELVHKNLATAYHEKGDYRSAVASLKRQIKLTPRKAIAYHDLAISYESLNNRQEAYDNYLRFLELDRSDTQFTRYACDRANSLHTWLAKDLVSVLFSGLTAPCKRFPSEYVPSQPDYTQDNNGCTSSFGNADGNCDGALDSYEIRVGGGR